MANQKNFGEQILGAVQDAISSQDYSKLNETVEQTIGTATENISKGIQKAVEEAREQAETGNQRAAYRPEQYPRTKSERKTFNDQWINEPYSNARREESENKTQLAVVGDRYVSTGSMRVSGYLMAIVGGIWAAGFGVGALARAIVSVVTGGGSLMLIILLLLCIGGVGVMVKGVRKIGLANRFRKYIRWIGTNTYCDISTLAARLKKTDAFVLADVKKMLKQGLFRYGHLDRQDKCLMVTEEAYAQYQQAMSQLEERQKQEKLLSSIRKNEKKNEAHSAEVQAFLEEGNAYIVKIHTCNDDIPGEEISDKISHMENIVRKIFQRVDEHPEVIDDLKRLTDYYLPTTVKLLDAYIELDRQPVQGENIVSSKREIENTLDTLNVAFEKLLDSIFRDMAWDVSTDISVLHTILAQEGLTRDAFKS